MREPIRHVSYPWKVFMNDGGHATLQDALILVCIDQLVPVELRLFLNVLDKDPWRGVLELL